MMESEAGPTNLAEGATEDSASSEGENGHVNVPDSEQSEDAVGPNGNATADPGKNAQAAAAETGPAASPDTLPPADTVEESGQKAAQQSEGKYDHYRVGMQCKTGETIKRIVGRGRDYIVIQVARSDGNGSSVRIEYEDEIEERIAPALSRFAELKILAESRLGTVQNDHAQLLLGYALSDAILRNKAASTDRFKMPLDFIRTKADQRSRLFYLGSALFSAGTLALIVFLARWAVGRADLAPILTGGLAGILGGVVASILGNSTLDIDPFSADSYVSIQGSMRALLSLGFGVLAAILVKAQLVLGAMDKTPEGLIAFCVVAGFSQRFVPELLGRIELQAGPHRGSNKTPHTGLDGSDGAGPNGDTKVDG